MSGSPVLSGQSWTADVGGMRVDLPIVPIRHDFAISLMMVIDLGVKFGEFVGRRLASKLAPFHPEVVVGAATLGIPIAIEVSRALGLDRYVILQKSPKVHLQDALEQKISSITSKGEQRLLLDRRTIPLLAGKRTVMVDDVVASGSSLKGSLELLRSAGADVVGVGVILTEAREWQATLGADRALIRSLGHIPQFRAKAGQWVPMPETFL
ncbi:phosphoribosyltransferase family protein [Ancylobacter mangrovi]|uniref:phosphoribosyltransferase family protein n=1 Tax=Ancylobacter mangrovi TaxID=2972472 RepID=UPI002161F638|nr:phosphoribosyltransferase family protein [Ancylobacter mangrovi]MCS0502202.1 phosphoribosyltransferase family protein [Ancylobacter mangrovi]